MSSSHSRINKVCSDEGFMSVNCYCRCFEDSTQHNNNNMMLTVNSHFFLMTKPNLIILLHSKYTRGISTCYYR
jgi:hypothetical protein